MGHGVVDIFHERVFQGHPVSRLGLIAQERLTEFSQRVDLVHRHELGTQGVFRRMEGHRQSHPEPRFRQGVDAWHNARSRNGHVAHAHVAHPRLMNHAQGLEDLGGVEQRLPHAHEHHVLYGHSHVMFHGQQVPHDLSRRHVPHESPLPRGTEGTSQSASYLRREAGGPVGRVGEEH